MVNKSNLSNITRVLDKLFSAGFNTEKSILKMQMQDIKKLSGGLTSSEIEILIQLQEAIKKKEIIAFFSGYKQEGGGEEKC